MIKRTFILAAVLFAFASAASAQKAPDFSGTWVLDLAKSKLHAFTKDNLASEVLTVAQTATEITVIEKQANFVPPSVLPAGAAPKSATYDLDPEKYTYILGGRPVETEIKSIIGDSKTTTRSKIVGRTLEITRVTVIKGSEILAITKWWVNADGTLTIETQRPKRQGGVDTMTSVYTKKL
jgi:hypothetical protein